MHVERVRQLVEIACVEHAKVMNTDADPAFDRLVDAIMVPITAAIADLKAERNRLMDDLSYADLVASGGLPEAQTEKIGRDDCKDFPPDACTWPLCGCEKRTQFTPAETIMGFLIAMRESGSWDARTLRRAIEIAGNVVKHEASHLIAKA